MTQTIICILAYNRPEYLTKVVDSLKKAKGIENYPIICSVDGGDKNQQLAIESVIQESNLGMEYILHEDNKGCAGNMGYLLSWAFNEKKADRVIVIEEDVIVSEDALEFLSFCLDKYENDKRFFSIGLGRYPDYKKESLGIMFKDCNYNTDNTKQVNLNGWFMCWGWATWKRVWEEIETEEWFGLKQPFEFTLGPFNYRKKWVWDFHRKQHNSLKGSWAAPMATYWIKGRLCVEPEIARSQNIGTHGSFMGNHEEIPTRWEDLVRDESWIGNGQYEIKPKPENLQFPTEDDIENHYQFLQQLGV